MKLISLKLVNFRSYEKANFKFSQSTAIIGKNGSGKSNLIEAIRFLSILRPYRAKKQEEIISFDKTQAGLYGQGFTKEKDFTINIVVDRQGKQVKIDKKTQRVSQAIGRLKTVMFAPDENISLFRAPSPRRKYIDSVISQKNKVYLNNLLELHHAVKQRNALLGLINQGYESQDNLDFWDNKVVDLSKKIQSERHNVLNDFNKSLDQDYQEISGQNKSEFKIAYRPSETSVELMKKRQALDLKFQTTSLGAHRDDIDFMLNQNSLGQFGSRGEQRSGITALKRREIEFLTETLDGIIEKPILLLDDIFSELDNARQKNILSLIGSQQTILTATAINPMIKKYCKQIIEL